MIRCMRGTTAQVHIEPRPVQSDAFQCTDAGPPALDALKLPILSDAVQVYQISPRGVCHYAVLRSCVHMKDDSVVRP